MKSFHPVTKALGGSRLLLECDFFFFKGGQQQKNSSLNQNTQPLQFFSQPLFLFAFPKTGLVCKGVLDLRLRLFCKESPKTSQFSSIHIYSASDTSPMKTNKCWAPEAQRWVEHCTVVGDSATFGEIVIKPRPFWYALVGLIQKRSPALGDQRRGQVSSLSVDWLQHKNKYILCLP